MPHPGQKRAARRALDRHGRDVTHVTFSSSTTDAYGDPEWSETTQTVTARLRQTRNPYQSRDGDELDARQKTTIYVKDSVTITDETGDTRPDEFRLDGDEYKVSLAQHQANGLIACDCRLKS